jgi:Domain of unknown function (DUF397)
MEDKIDPRWRKSSYSGNGGGNCVEIAAHGGMILVRDTKDRGHGPVHRFTPAAWRRFADLVKRSLTLDPAKAYRGTLVSESAPIACPESC